MTTPEQFIADIGDFVDKYLDNMDTVYQMSVSDTVAIAQTPTSKGGRMRVDTGFLRGSLVGELRGSTSTFPDGDGYDLLIARAKAGDPMTFGWTADYALPREFKDFFARGAAQQWQRIAEKNARLVEAELAQ